MESIIQRGRKEGHSNKKEVKNMSEIGSQEWIDNVVKAARDNRANQLNPNNPAYYSSRAGSESDSESNAVALVALGAVVAAGVTAAAIWAFNKFKKKKSEPTIELSDEDFEEIEVE